MSDLKSEETEMSFYKLVLAQSREQLEQLDGILKHPGSSVGDICNVAVAVAKIKQGALVAAAHAQSMLMSTMPSNAESTAADPE